MKKKKKKLDSLTAGDVKKGAGLTYRQLNEWDEKGVLPEQQRKEAGWRKYTPQQVFTIMVMAHIRKKFGTPVESLKFVKTCLLEHNYLRRALVSMAYFNVPVLLITDLKSLFDVDVAPEIATLISMGAIWTGGSDKEARSPSVIIFDVCPLIEKLFGLMKPPLKITRGKIGFEFWNQNNLPLQPKENESIEYSLDEPKQYFLEVTRSGKYESIELKLKNGEIKILSETQQTIGEISKFSELLHKSDYQSLKIKLKDGKVISFKPKKNDFHEGSSPNIKEPKNEPL